MILIRVKNKTKFPIQFMLFLKNILLTLFINNLNFEKLLAFEQSLKNMDLEIKSDTNFNILECCELAITASIIQENPDNYTLSLDPNLKYHNIKVNELIKLMDNGTLEIPPYQIFKDIKKIIESDLDSFYSLFQINGII